MTVTESWVGRERAGELCAWTDAQGEVANGGTECRLDGELSV